MRKSWNSLREHLLDGFRYYDTKIRRAGELLIEILDENLSKKADFVKSI